MVGIYTPMTVVMNSLSGDLIQSPQIRSLAIEGMGVASRVFFHNRPTPPQPLLRVDSSVRLLSVLISAEKAG